MGAKKILPVPGATRRVLVYENRKTDPYYWDASNEELEAGAYLGLFEVLDEVWRVYDSLKEEEKPYYKRPDGHVDGCMCEECKAFRNETKAIPNREKERIAHLELYKRAKKGEAIAARKLLEQRKDGEYEVFKFAKVTSIAASYPPRVWGVQKPCGEAFVAENGLYKWGIHGRVETRDLREKIPEYGYRPGQKAAIEYLTKGGILHFDPKTKTEVDLGDEVWSFKPRKEGQTDEDWIYRGLNGEEQYMKTGIPLLEQGSFKPGKVIHLTEQFCGGCRRDMKRFNED